MNSLDGIDELHMSGSRAVFSVESDKLPEAELAKAFEAQGMKLESYELVTRERAESRYLVDAGVT